MAAHKNYLGEKKNSDDEALLPSNYLYSVWDWTQTMLVFQASQRTLS